MDAQDQDELLKAAREGDSRAEAALFERYLQRLLALAESRLSPKLARRVAADDVVQSVMRTFFLRLRDGRIQIDGLELWRLLAKITVRKVAAQAKHHYQGKRTLAQEQSTDGESSSLGPEEPFARDPTPSEAEAARDELERFLSPFSPVERKIIELRLQGSTFEEIASQTGRAEYTARRLINRVTQQLEQRAAGEPD